MVAINDLNKMSLSEFTRLLGGIFEHSPWVAEAAGKFRPFPSLPALHERMVQIVEEASLEDQLTLIRLHPNLGTRLEVSPSSREEQKNVGLNQLSPEEYENFSILNEQYMRKFDFPFIMAVKGRTKDELYSAMKLRVNNEQSVEFETALSEIYKIALFRLNERIEQ
ncbi:OHCU decarboxylase [Bacillus fengqiuensis]|nr:OHCU decarboxylase [Bacillus fengqiuensis]